WRQRYARPILEDLWSWLEEQEQRCPPGDTAIPLVSTSTPVANTLLSTSASDRITQVRLTGCDHRVKMRCPERHVMFTSFLGRRALMVIISF
ncbi:hypothetical protein E1L25_27040, partial [Salmonella enterica subsp. enterica serovar Newport]|nr:hypothetical protein [Salmonella enterica subsp. enterica serovar Newport]